MYLNCILIKNNQLDFFQLLVSELFDQNYTILHKLKNISH